MSDHVYERLTQLDNSFLLFEGPNAPMHVAAVQIYEAAPLSTAEGGIDVDRIRAYVLARLHRIPRYRQRLAWTPLERHPIWVDDPRFNLAYHVRHVRLPPPGDERLLKRIAARILSQQLDRGKPLWEMWVIEGLQGDRFALVSKTHHCMVDGIAGVDLLAALMTPEPRTEIRRPPVWIPRPAPGPGPLLRSEAWRWVTGPLRATASAWRLARDVQHARHDVKERATALAQTVGGALRNSSSTPLNQPIGPHRRFDWLPMRLDEIRRVRQALGGSVNDVVLATVAGALRRFLREGRQVDVSRLDFRVAAPVSLRSREQRGTFGNRVSAWLVPLPLGEPDPGRRLEAIRRTTDGLKASRQALGGEALARVTEWTGPTLLSIASRLATRRRLFNLVVTNVPGPQMPLYLLGARMLEAYPMVPLFGNLATGIALFSYDGALYWGVVGDWDLVPDLHDLVLALEASFGELLQAAGTRAAS